MKNNYSDWLIANPGTRLDGHLITLDIHLPWYRSLPLSVIEIDSLRVDSQEIGLGKAELEINAKRFPLSALRELVDEWWFVQDSGYLHVPAVTLDPTRPHKVELLFKLYPPYIPMLTWATRGTAALAAK